MSPRRRSLQRLEISREAIRLFREQGVEATSAEQIAAAVGLSVRTFWRYFRSKEACVEPLLTLSVDAFVDTVRRWPADLSLEQHLVQGYRPAEQAAPGDLEAAMAVIAMSPGEPALRAIWLVIYERAEPVLAQVIAERLGRAPGELAVRVQAATLAAALRIASEDLAAGVGDPVARLSDAIRAATHGVLDDA
jgi:AcrR family transcriptional regulator